MKLIKYNMKGLILFLLAGVGIAMQSNAAPNVKSGLRPSGEKRGQLKTTASCKPAESAIDLDINNVRARLMTGGDMWWDNGTQEARYEVPKGTRKNSLFAGSVWIGGFDEQKQLKVAAQTYRQSGNDYWPGPLNPSTADIDAADCSEWDRFWKVNRETITKFRELSSKGAAEGDAEYEVIFQWPAKGNPNAVGRNQNPLNLYAGYDYAPFVDVDNNGEYNPLDGDYPDINGDQFIWWVFNDKGNVKLQSNTEGIGIEVQASAFAYSTKDFLNDATFYNYRLINRGSLSLDSTYIATWTDADLGYYRDDYIGCDTTRGLGILYNGTSFDGSGQVNSYGDKIPMVGVDFFKGPIKYELTADSQKIPIQLSMEAFTYYNNDNTVIGNPNNGIEIYYYMSGSIRNGQRFSNDFKGPNINSKAYGDGPLTKYVFFGDPGNKTEWSECTCNNPVNDRRFVHSSGPFRLEPGVVNDITIGAVWVSDVGGCPNTSFRKIRVADDLAQGLFDNNFQTIEGPEAPRMVVRALDRRLVFYLLNDSISNNFQERYGYDTSEEKYVVTSTKASKYVKHPDSLYKFEGYRVFQLKNAEVTPAQIFGDNGELNTDLAQEVFQCDIRNGVTKIINYDNRTDISDTTFVPIVKVDGADSGVSHSFEVTIDRFATGEDKKLVNYRNYYFVAVAYAYNNFLPFDAKHADSTQDVSYLESSHGAGGTSIPVTIGMPNPANGDMGTVLNANYGDGVIIKRLEGRGNGGNSLDMSKESEEEALTGVSLNGTNKILHQSINPTYVAGHGPVQVKVVDPVKLVPDDWEIFLEGKQIDDIMGMDSFSTWKLVRASTGEEVYSERNIDVLNEQIIEDYGFSVQIKQVYSPGYDQVNGNGYIESNITFNDPSRPWLAGVPDQESRSYANWIRSGNSTDTSKKCNWNDKKLDTVGQFYEKMIDNYSTTAGTWAPYGLATDEDSSLCGFGVAKKANSTRLESIPSVDIVFTADKNKWTRALVFEMQDNAGLAEGYTRKFNPRSHASWNMEYDQATGRPIYATESQDTGFSYFPGYAINQETGERLNIAFGEDSWLKDDNGADMLWNPSTRVFLPDGPFGSTNVVFGGKHYIYIINTKYDSCRSFLDSSNHPNPLIRGRAFNTFAYVGVPILNPFIGGQLNSIEQGFIPTTTRIRIRVTRPYSKYNTDINGQTQRNDGFPLYSFSTKNIAPVKLSDNSNADKDALLARIHAVPNPYYGYTGYERNRYDTRVRIINLPAKATVSIYSLDGSLIRRLEKDDANLSYIDWDIRNAKSLPISSGMYLIHVKADGIGETVLRWFGAMRPIDITNY